ncbi:hypothetical protein ACFL05_00360 [Patescibacteria group bacterium]
MSKYGNRTLNWFESVINKMGGEERAEAFKRGELVLSKPVPSRWVEDKNGLIHLPPILGLGLTGPGMEDKLTSEGHSLSDDARSIFHSEHYVPCEKGKVYYPVVVPGKLFSDEKRTTKNVRAKGDSFNLIHGESLPTELGTLVCISYTNEEIEAMGLKWLLVIHEPIEDSDGVPRLFGTDWIDSESWLVAYWDRPDHQCSRGNGFVFFALQTSPED